MDRRPVLFLDSGIGGIPYCRHFRCRNPAENIVYLADRANFPYGKRERDDLAAALRSLVERLVSLTDPKIVVLACNTATVSAISLLRESFPGLPFVGTVPAIKPAVSGRRQGKVGVLGTGRTLADPCIADLAAKYGPGCEIIGIAAPELVEFVEYRCAVAGPEEKTRTILPYLERFRAAGADSLVLGCTHFLHLLDEFRREAGPAMSVYDSVEGISRRIESILDGPGCGRGEGGEGRFLVTGDAAGSSWGYWAGSLGFSLSALGDPAGEGRGPSGGAEGGLLPEKAGRIGGAGGSGGAFR
ncbi:MAG: glutamate racemase [Treponema sp.]|jgi:glutamate racemase|nr:glutamate racemase [Treponema sp.]